MRMHSHRRIWVSVWSSPSDLLPDESMTLKLLFSDFAFCTLGFSLALLIKSPNSELRMTLKSHFAFQVFALLCDESNLRTRALPNTYASHFALWVFTLLCEELFKPPNSELEYPPNFRTLQFLNFKHLNSSSFTFRTNLRYWIGKWKDLHHWITSVGFIRPTLQQRMLIFKCQGTHSY